MAQTSQSKIAYKLQPNSERYGNDGPGFDRTP